MFKGMVLAEAGVDGGAGGGNGGTGTALTGAGAGGGSGAAGSGAGGFVLPDKWQSQLPDDLKGEPSIQHFTDFPTLIKSFVNAQKSIGAEKIAIPGKTATDKDWIENVYKKLGLPENVEKYEVKPPQQLAEEKEFVGKFKEAALSVGILPKQAQKVLDLMGETLGTAQKNQQMILKSEQEKDIGNLRNEWGKAFDSNLKIAKLALDKFGDPQLTKLLESTGLGNNSAMIKAFKKVGEILGEDSIIGEGGSPDQVFEPSVAKQKYAAILGDMTHPYNIKDHVNHGIAVKEVQGLFQQAYPEVSA